MSAPAPASVPASVPAPAPTAAPCRFYQSPGGCLRGTSCTFRHGTGAATEPPPPMMTEGGGHHSHGGYHHHPRQTTYEPHGSATSGAMASYSPGNPYATAAVMGLPSGAAPLPCRFYPTEAGCRNGGACPFAHLGTAYPLPYAAMLHAQSPSPPPPPPPLPTSHSLHGGYPFDDGLHDGGHANDTGDRHGEMSANGNGNDHVHVHGDGNGYGLGKPRRKLQIQANPSKKANYEVISEILPVLTREIEGPFFAIDVECVATGPGVDDRDVARIAMVNEEEEVFYDQHVKPEKPIVSYLTQLTGISESNLVGAPSLPEALVQLREILPADSVIVGQSIKKDLEWLGLTRGPDYKDMFDVADLFRIPMQSKNGTIRYRYFSLRHVAKYLLGDDIQEADHDPVIDAKYAMKVFKQFRHLHESPGRRDAVYQTLLQTPRTPSFAERYPVIDGVLMRVPRKPRDKAPPATDSMPSTPSS